MGDDDRQIKYIKVGMDFTQMVTNRILENLEGEEKEEQLDQMRRVMMDYVKMEAEYNCSKEVLYKLKKGLESENADMNRDVESEYRDILKKEMEGKRLSDDSVLKTDPRYRKLEHLIQSGGQSQIQEDEDLAVTEDEVTYTDPWSRTLITDESVTNKKCKHTYDKKTAMRMIDNSVKSKKALKCPVVGCSNKDPILKAHLYTDPEIQRKVAKQRKR